jgi:hypothetical protein
LNPGDRELEEALASLRPRDPHMNRDALLFHAGQASERRKRRRWQAVAGALALLLGVSLGLRPQPGEVVRVVRVQEPRPAPQRPFDDSLARATLIGPAAPALPQPAYLVLRQAVLRRGLDALRSADPAPPSANAPSVQWMLDLGPSDLGGGALFLQTGTKIGGQL